MTLIPKARCVVYIGHPITTHGDIQSNLLIMERLRTAYWEAGAVPVLSTRVLADLAPVTGDQTTAYEACMGLARRCDAAHFYGEYHASTGVMLEVQSAIESARFVRVKIFDKYPWEDGSTKCVHCGADVPNFAILSNRSGEICFRCMYGVGS